MNSLNINKNKDVLIESLKKRGFTDNQINYFLNLDYRVFDDYKEYNDDLFIQYYDSYLSLMTSDQKITIDGFFKDVGENFKGILKTKNISLDDALSLRLWSSHFYKDILKFKRSLSPSNKIKTMIFDDLETSLKSEYEKLSDEQINKIMDFAKNVDLNMAKFDFWEKVRSFSDDIGLKEVSILGTLERFRLLMTEVIPAIDSIDRITKHKLDENTVLYRGLCTMKYDFDNIYELIGRPFDEKAYTSTSLVQKSSFAFRDDYPICIEIYAPKGTECFDITPFSRYYKENEFLLAPNELIVFDVNPNYVDHYGNDKIMIKALAISKDRKCYKDTCLNNTLLHEEEIFDGKQ